MPQSLARNLLHVVFSTKDRAPLLPYDPAGLYSYARECLRDLQCECLAIGGTQDHLHLVIDLHRTRPLSDVIGKLKATTSRWLHLQSPVNQAFSWQAGYGAFSVGPGEIAELLEYIRRQAEHHQTLGYRDELLRLLIHHAIDYDERYMWD